MGQLDSSGAVDLNGAVDLKRVDRAKMSVFDPRQLLVLMNSEHLVACKHVHTKRSNWGNPEKLTILRWGHLPQSGVVDPVGQLTPGGSCPPWGNCPSLAAMGVQVNEVNMGEHLAEKARQPAKSGPRMTPPPDVKS